MFYDLLLYYLYYNSYINFYINSNYTNPYFSIIVVKIF